MTAGAHEAGLPGDATPSGVPRISLVIPAYNEKAYLPRLLDSVDAARRAYQSGPDAVEVIVADNVSTDTTAAIAAERGCVVARVEKRDIGAVRNGGVAVARAGILAFVDADIPIHPDSFNVIEKTLANPGIVAGATGDRWERMSFAIWITDFLTFPLARMGHFERGIVFCRRADFDAIGGFSEEKLFGEDIKFVRDLCAHGRRNGRKFARPRGARGVRSTRKMDKFGDWHLLKIILQASYRMTFSRRTLKADREQFAKMYWYDDPKR